MANNAMVYPEILPSQLGLRNCRNCRSTAHIVIRTVKADAHALFVRIECTRCGRTVNSKLVARTTSAYKEVTQVWNSIAPDISHYLDADSEGLKGEY